MPGAPMPPPEKNPLDGDWVVCSGSRKVSKWLLTLRVRGDWVLDGEGGLRHLKPSGQRHGRDEACGARRDFAFGSLRFEHSWQNKARSNPQVTACRAILRRSRPHETPPNVARLRPMFDANRPTSGVESGQTLAISRPLVTTRPAQVDIAPDVARCVPNIRGALGHIGASSTHFQRLRPNLVLHRL